jgi:hypothetical protein
MMEKKVMTEFSVAFLNAQSFIQIPIPNLDRLMTFQAWDSTVGLFLAFVTAVSIGIIVVVEEFARAFDRSGGYGARKRQNWVLVNLLIGILLSISAMVLTGSWLVGTAAAIGLYFLLREIRIKWS